MCLLTHDAFVATSDPEGCVVLSRESCWAACWLQGVASRRQCGMGTGTLLEVGTERQQEASAEVQHGTATDALRGAATGGQ